jgi:hypothetical protein
MVRPIEPVNPASGRAAPGQELRLLTEVVLETNGALGRGPPKVRGAVNVTRAEREQEFVNDFCIGQLPLDKFNTGRATDRGAASKPSDEVQALGGDPSINHPVLKKLRVTSADTKGLVTDFRRFDAQEWLRFKAECLRAPTVEVPKEKDGDAQTVSIPARELRRRLVNILHLGATQTVQQDCYPTFYADAGQDKLGFEVPVMLSDAIPLPMRPSGLALPYTWYGRGNIEPLMAHIDAAKADPCLCSYDTPLDALHTLRAEFQGKATVVLDISDFLDDASLGARGVESVQEQFLFRTSLLSIVEMACAELPAFSGGLKGTLMDPTDPYVLYCRDVVLFRARDKEGYAFLETPVRTDVIITAP